MSKRALWGRWALLMLAVLLPIAAAVAYAWVHWGQLAVEGVQVVLKMVVIP